MADEVVRSRFEAETSGYDRAMERSAKVTDKFADSADKAGKATEQSAQKQERAAQNAAKAQDRSADAAGRLRVAQQKLNDARTSGDTTRIVAAEEGVAKAQRDVERTAQEAASAQDALQRELAGSGDAAQQSTGKFERLSKAVKDHRGDMEQVGTVALAAGAGLTAAAAGMGKAAMDWETAWVGVNKTVDGSAEEMAALEGELRTLATTLPATHTEIAAVAEAAGQLGIAREDVAAFTRTMIDLGETTNLTAEEAATTLAQFMNIMGTSADDIDNLGSSLVALGNDGASTEKDILMMGMRVAAVGKQMGMSEDQVMALASAMSSVGIEAEAGGTAISMVMKKIDTSVREGGDSLTGWAEAAGVSAEEFANAWQNRPAEAMVMLTSGLGDVAANGGDVNGMLADLGVKGVREADTMLRLAQSGDLLAESFETGAESFASASALADEASKRYETAESRIAVSWNKIKDSAIDAGGAILPVVATVTESIGGIAEVFSALPDPVKAGLGALTGAGGIALLAAGGFLTLAPRVVDTVDAMRGLGVTGARAKSALRIGGIATGAAVGITALVTGLTALYNSTRDAAPGVEEVANATLKLNEAGDSADLDSKFDFSGITTHVNGFGDALKRIDLSNPIKHVQSFGDTVFQQDNVMSQVRDTITSLDQALATMDAESAAQQMNALRIEAESVGRMDLSSWTELQRVFPEYAKGVEAAANATGQATSEADLFQAAMGNLPAHMQAVAEGGEAAGEGAAAGAEGINELGEAAEETEESLSDIVDAMMTLGVINRDAQAATDAHQQSLRDLAESFKENGMSIEGNTEKAAANRAATREVAETAWDAAAALAEQGAAHGDVRAELESGYAALYETARASGMNATAAEEWAKAQLGIDRDVEVSTWMDESAARMAEFTGQAVEAIPGYKGVTVAVSEDGTAGSVQEKINEVTGKTEHIFVTEDGTTIDVQAKIRNINGVERTVWVDDNGTVYGTQQDINNIEGTDVVARAHAETAAAEREFAQLARTRSVKFVASGLNNLSSSLSGMMNRFGGYTGGMVGRDFGLPRLANGGRLPYYGLGTDTILGIGSHGRPTALVDDGEFVEPEPMTRKYLGVLEAIRVDHPSIQHLAGLQGGGTVGREWSGSSINVGLDYERLEASLGGRGGPQINLGGIHTIDPTAAAKVAVGDLQHALEVNGL
ncbi:phage tail tape measure protein [Citricoccus sp. K5]|uniref:phage tail tape measure protein n=1 Tax=Citricoccus sp. K5 TaxID=2653135 RepID=UPI0012F04935|nr:phage tail tape measure protein [Citricoccus sp. K5]VXA92267.1 hypothetical protein CITRIK5_100013 [Citricoccus sp. K5]VXA94207.1 hypothetical protein CITRIK5_100079 [Citricoccus sp. K5]